MHIHSFKARKKSLNNKYLLSNKMPGSWFFFLWTEFVLFENYSRSEIAIFQAKKNN